MFFAPSHPEHTPWENYPTASGIISTDRTTAAVCNAMICIVGTILVEYAN